MSSASSWWSTTTRPPRLYRDVFGLEALMDLEADGGHGVILKLPAATLELADAEHGAVVDRIEVGRALGNRVRIAVQVDDLAEAAGAVSATGAEPMADPVGTPWSGRNSGSESRTACSSPCTRPTERLAADPPRPGGSVRSADTAPALRHPAGHETTRMENSEELRRVIERFFDAVRDGDEQAVTNRISRQPGFERFGSDPDEWWRDGEQAALIWRQQMREIGAATSGAA